MEISHNESRAEQIHRVMALTMHNMRMHHMIVEKRMEGVCPGLHHSQHRLLMVLAKMGRTASQKDIAQALNVTPACVARALKALSQKGLVTRQEGAQDGRCNEVCLSEKGAQLVEESHALFQALDLEMYDCFTDEEIQQLQGLMARLNANLMAIENPDSH